MTQLQRLSNFFAWSDQQAAPILAEMERKAGGPDRLDGMTPGNFATLACRVAEAFDRRSESDAQGPPIADRVDHYLGTLDRVATADNPTRRKILDSESAEITAAMTGRGRPPVVLIRRSVALVPTLADGLVKLRPFPVRLLDVEMMDGFESRVVAAAATWMAGDPLTTPALADLVEAVKVTTDATDREARSVVTALGSCDHQDEPRDLVEFAELAAALLDRLRFPIRRSRPIGDSKPWLNSSLDLSEDDR